MYLVGSKLDRFPARCMYISQLNLVWSLSYNPDDVCGDFESYTNFTP
jgi:hypothetical protein